MNRLCAQLRAALADLSFRRDDSKRAEGQIWYKRCSLGTVWLNSYEFRHNGPRLELEIGVVIDRFVEVIEEVSSQLLPFGGRYWHPLFHFGWALGQNNRDGTAGGGDISFEGSRGALFLDGSADLVATQTQRIVHCVKNVAFPVFGSAAECGHISADMLSDDRRFSPKFQFEIMQSLGYGLMGRFWEAEEVLFKRQEFLSKQGWKGSALNHDRMKSIIKQLKKASELMDES